MRPWRFLNTFAWEHAKEEADETFTQGLRLIIIAGWVTLIVSWHPTFQLLDMLIGVAVAAVMQGVATFVVRFARLGIRMLVIRRQVRNEG
ncbi:hypothetical protein [Inquilinus sp. OTU3971]|uniref:hypothetical protein n=1 Tax=Inquilinus sp. OTU3971 TaxID=3043855 RepID=UPI00313B7E8F